MLVVVPTRPVGIADGLPADNPLELWIAFLLVGGFFVLPWQMEPRRASRFALALAAVAVLKLAVASASLPHGLVARYYANTEFKGPPEASLEWRIPGATRLDRSIEFAPVGFSWRAKPFPLWFLNDSIRFNYYKPGEPNRRKLPFSVRWDGFVRSPGSEPIVWRLSTEGESTLFILGQPVASTPDGNQQVTLSLEPGWHPIALTYVYRGESLRSLKLEWGHDGEFHPIPSSAFLPFRPSPPAEQWERRMDWPARAAFVLQFIVVGLVLASGLVGIPRKGLFTEGVVVYILVAVMLLMGTTSLAKRGRTPDWNILNGGDDPLVYETAARQIVMERDLLNRMERTQPFFFMVGYRYFLAAAHALMGESKAMIVMSQYLLLAVACALLYYLVRFMAPPGPSLLAASMLFAGQAHGTVYRWATELFPAMLGIALVAGMFVALAHWDRRLSYRSAAGAGLLAGLATVVRPNVIVFSPVAFLWMGMTPYLPRARRWKQAALTALVATLLIAPVTWRNWYVSGQFVLLVRSGPEMLFVGNKPPSGVIDFSRIDKEPLYERLKLHPRTRMVLEYMRQRPGDFMKGLGWKVLTTLGIADPFSPSLLLLHLGYIAGAVLLWRAGVARRLAVMMHGFVLFQWLLLVILKPGPHLPKTQLPTFIVAFAFASIFIVALTHAAVIGHLPSFVSRPRRWRPATRLLGGAAALGLLAFITLPARLPFIVPLLLWLIWSLNRDSKDQLLAFGVPIKALTFSRPGRR